MTIPFWRDLDASERPMNFRYRPDYRLTDRFQPGIRVAVLTAAESMEILNVLRIRIQNRAERDRGPLYAQRRLEQHVNRFAAKRDIEKTENVEVAAILGFGPIRQDIEFPDRHLVCGIGLGTRALHINPPAIGDDVAMRVRLAALGMPTIGPKHRVNGSLRTVRKDLPITDGSEGITCDALALIVLTTKPLTADRSAATLNGALGSTFSTHKPPLVAIPTADKSVKLHSRAVLNNAPNVSPKHRSETGAQAS